MHQKKVRKAPRPKGFWGPATAVLALPMFLFKVTRQGGWFDSVFGGPESTIFLIGTLF